VAPFRQNLVVGCECLFAWYFLGNLCEDHEIPFILGMLDKRSSIHGGQGEKRSARFQKD